ncbi:MAG: AMP-binding protein [Parachlamydia sp.]|nr:AMP-binding protein [Parachlamydia sp.]
MIFPLESYADQIALIDADAGREISYGELSQLSGGIASAMEVPRALAFLFTQNGWQEVAAYLALINGGHAVCLLDERLDQELKARLVETYRPHLIFCSSDNAWQGFRRLHSPLDGLQMYCRLHLDEAPRLHPDLCLLLTSSGTTGSPKMIRLSTRNLLSNATSIVAYLGITASERALASLPIHYSYGLSVLHTHLLQGASLILTRQSVVQAEFWKAAHDYQGTSFAGVPYTYALLDRIGFETFNLPQLKTMTQAGGALSKELVLKFHRLMQERQGRFFVMYGQTEATARIAYLPSESLPAKAGSIGKAIPSCQLKIYDGEKQVTAPGQVGELVCEGPQVMLGYASAAEDLEEGDQLKGVLRTGDLGYFDNEGYITLTGRSKRISKAYGYRINLDEIEGLLRPLACVAATSDDQQIALYIEGGTPALAEQCAKLVADKYHLHYSTFKTQCVEQLPRTLSGKIDYPRLTP